MGVLFVGCYLFYMLVFHSLANMPLGEGLLFGVQMRFWQQPNVIVFIWAGVGLSSLLSPPVLPRSIGSRLSPLIALALVGTQLGRWYALSDQHASEYTTQYVRAITAPMPRPAPVITATLPSKRLLIICS